MSKFASALDRKAEEIKRPPNLPIGHYIWQINKHPAHTEMKNGYSKLSFPAAVVAPTDDVDETELEEFGNVVGQICRKDFIFNENDGEEVNFERTLSDVKDFLERCGIDVSKGDMKTWLAASVNAQFMGELSHRPDPQDAETVYQEIRRTAPAE